MDNTTIFPNEQTMWKTLYTKIETYASDLRYPNPRIPKQIWQNNDAMYKIFAQACETKFGKNPPYKNYDHNKPDVKSYIKHLPQRLQNDYYIILTALRYGLHSQDIPKNLRDDRNIAYMAAEYSDIDAISTRWKNDEEFAHWALEHDPTNVIVLSDKIRKKINADKLAVAIFENKYHAYNLNTIYSHFFEFLTNIVYKNANKTETIRLIKSIGWSTCVPEKYKNDMDVLKTIVKYDLRITEDINYFNHYIINKGPLKDTHLSDNKLAEIYLNRCAAEWGTGYDEYYEYFKNYKHPKVSRRRSWYFTNSTITNDPKIMLKYIRKNPHVINIISPSLEKDTQFALQLCSIYGADFDWSKYARKPLIETIKNVI